jgi:4-hydroxybenzoate polyprenyltransferase
VGYTKILRGFSVFLSKIAMYGNMVKFSHTIFALPFAFSAIILAQNKTGAQLTLSIVFWILMAMIGARSAAMGFNRIVDAGFDSKNPRTALREIPSGKLSVGSSVLFVLLFSFLFVFSALMLGLTCFYFSLPVLGLLFLYSYTKRFTWLCHFYLGFTISLAPAGAWIAVTNSISFSVILLSLGLMTHIAGFDIIYACQDSDFDKKEGLFSLPVYFGIKRALYISSFMHFISFAFFITLYFVFEMNKVYLYSVFIIGVLFVIEHILVDSNDLTKINMAFFHINSIISVVLFLGILIDGFT